MQFVYVYVYMYVFMYVYIFSSSLNNTTKELRVIVYGCGMSWRY